MRNEHPDFLKGKLYLNESQGWDDEKLDNEVDYLLDLKKFRTQKALKIRKSLFKDVEPGILEIEIPSKHPEIISYRYRKSRQWSGVGIFS